MVTRMIYFTFGFVLSLLLAVAFVPSRMVVDRHQERCPGSHSVIANGKWVGCVNDSPQALNVWVPKGGVPPMSPMREYSDAWMDAP